MAVTDRPSFRSPPLKFTPACHLRPLSAASEVAASRVAVDSGSSKAMSYSRGVLMYNFNEAQNTAQLVAFVSESHLALRTVLVMIYRRSPSHSSQLEQLY